MPLECPWDVLGCPRVRAQAALPSLQGTKCQYLGFFPTPTKPGVLFFRHENFSALSLISGAALQHLPPESCRKITLGAGDGEL